jgi:hypothetical protein
MRFVGGVSATRIMLHTNSVHGSGVKLEVHVSATSTSSHNE